ncbi:sugar porter family MFS transporter [Micromonospora sp. NPDC049559]|uniref:sugar porter family MFS transporter n=1 Tax=Micromonospora sp. NPDC049559 TaxID=3155923 RepID=UPI003415F0AA
MTGGAGAVPARGFVRTLRANPVVVRVAAIAAVGGLLFGYDTGVIAGALLFVRRDFGAGPLAQEAVVSVLLIGATVGALVGGYLADRLGRRRTLIVAGGVYVVGALGCGLAPDLPTLVGCRFVLGLAVGAASFVSPMYISESVPPPARGGLTSFNQLAVTVGIAVAYLMNFALKDVPGNWRWMLGLAALPGLALVAGMLTLPETPRWLAEHGRDEPARAVLTRLDAGYGDADVEREVAGMRSGAGRRVATRDLFAPRLRRVFLVGLGLALFQQFVGVNTVIYYAPTILEQAGLGTDQAVSQALAVGLTNVAFTVLAILLLDRVGRRPLLLGGTAGLGVALLLLALYFGVGALRDSAPWLALAALLLFVAGFAIGLGPMFWLLISEIFPQRIRSRAMSTVTVANWLANFAVSATFLSLAGAATRTGAFLLYAFLTVLAMIFFWRRVPETRGVSLEEIEARLTRR